VASLNRQCKFWFKTPILVDIWIQVFQLMEFQGFPTWSIFEKASTTPIFWHNHIYLWCIKLWLVCLVCFLGALQLVNTDFSTFVRHFSFFFHICSTFSDFCPHLFDIFRHFSSFFQRFSTFFDLCEQAKLPRISANWGLWCLRRDLPGDRWRLRTVRWLCTAGGRLLIQICNDVCLYIYKVYIYMVYKK